ncbi:MAG: DUF1987 domain-containing protein, partial [Pseudomonadota bacterium]
MDKFTLEQTKSSPYVSFDPQSNHLEIRGECYPENAAAFFGPIFSWLEAYLAGLEDGDPVTMDIELIYFNSSASKGLMNIFDMLDEAAEEGRTVTVNWRSHP